MTEKAKTLLKKMRFLECVSKHRLPALQVRLAIMLVSLYNERKGYAWPTLDQITDDLGASRQGIMNAIEGLEAAGLFRVRRGKGCKQANQYFPCFDRVPEGNIYTLEKSTAVDHFRDATDATRKVNSSGGKVHSCPWNGQADLTLSEGVLSEGDSNRSSSEGPPDGGPPSPKDGIEDFDRRAGDFLRRVQLALKRDVVLEPNDWKAAHDRLQEIIDSTDHEDKMHGWAKGLQIDVELKAAY